VGPERGPLSLVSTIEELNEETAAAPVYKIENTVVGIRCVDHATLSIRKKLALTWPTSCGRSEGIVPSRTKATCHVVSVTDPYGHNLGSLDRRCVFQYLELRMIDKVQKPGNSKT
jgi:hypothetical protein